MSSIRGLTSKDTSLGSSDNALSKAIFVTQKTVVTSFSASLIALIGSYVVLRAAEGARYVKRVRNMRWMLPGGMALVAGFVGSHVGMHHAMDDLNARARIQRIYEAEKQQRVVEVVEVAEVATPPTQYIAPGASGAREIAQGERGRAIELALAARDAGNPVVYDRR